MITRKWYTGWMVLLTIFYPLIADAGLRGLPEGRPAVEVGQPAPLHTEDLKRAHEEGKIIFLLFGNPDHCIYCEKVWGSVNVLREQYQKEVVAILKTHRASKFWGPEDEAVTLGETYGVIGEPWLFLIDKGGIVRKIYRGLVLKREIEAGLRELLEAENAK